MSWDDSLTSLLSNPAVATLLPTLLGGVGGALSSPIMEGRRGAIGGAIRGAGQGLGEGIQNMQKVPLLQQQLQKEKILTQQAQLTLSNDQTKQQFAQSLPPDKQALFMSDPKGYMDTYVLAPHKAQTDMAALQEQSKSDPQLAAQLPSITKLDPSAQSKFADEYWKGQVPNKEADENRKLREQEHQETLANQQQVHADSMASQAEARASRESEEKANRESREREEGLNRDLRKEGMANTEHQQMATNIERSKPGPGFAPTDVDKDDNVTYVSPGLTSFTTKTMKVKVPGAFQYYHPDPPLPTDAHPGATYLRDASGVAVGWKDPTTGKGYSF